MIEAPKVTGADEKFIIADAYPLGYIHAMSTISIASWGNYNGVHLSRQLMQAMAVSPYALSEANSVYKHGLELVYA